MDLWLRKSFWKVFFPAILCYKNPNKDFISLMSEFKFNYDFLKKNATSGSWRRGYELYQKDMILESYPEKNFYKAKVKGNYQDFYITDLIFKKNKVEARCNCPLKEEWCKHSVAVALKAIEEGAFDNWNYEKTELNLI